MAGGFAPKFSLVGGKTRRSHVSSKNRKIEVKVPICWGEEEEDIGRSIMKGGTFSRLSFILGLSWL